MLANLLRDRAARPLLWGLPLLLVLHFSNLDFWLENRFFDQGARAFPFRHHWLFENLMHDGIKKLLLVLALWVIWRAGQALYRKEADVWHWGYLLTALIVAPLLISVLKSRSSQLCPWDLQIYGGVFPFHGLFDFGISNRGMGCFPAGHASGGYALLAFYFFWRGREPEKARVALWAGLITGSAMGLSQMVRGAHFLSHTLWTLWLVWLVLFLLDDLFGCVVSRKMQEKSVLKK